MALFWFVAGAMGMMAAIVVLLPWLRAIPRLESLPAASTRLLSIAALVLAASVGLYAYFGRPELAGSSPAIMLPAAAASRATGNPAATMQSSANSMQQAVSSLEARLAQGGGAADDWELLAKSYEFLGRPQDAALARSKHLPAQANDATGAAAAPSASATTAVPGLAPDSIKLLNEASADRRAKKLGAAADIYARLAAQNQLNADGWADYADTAASLNGGKLAGAAEGYVDRALNLDPRHAKALWLKASAAEEQGRWSEAVQLWQRLAAVLDPNSADAKMVAANLQQARQMSDPAAAASTAAVPGTAAAGAAAISGEVALADSLRSQTAHDATLFIVAKAVDSPGPPVAVLRSAADNWPVRFKLDDSLAMIPGRALSTSGRVTIEARVSRSGQALPARGDLKGSSGIVSPGTAQPVRILIDQVVQ